MIKHFLKHVLEHLISIFSQHIAEISLSLKIFTKFSLNTLQLQVENKMLSWLKNLDIQTLHLIHNT